MKKLLYIIGFFVLFSVPGISHASTFESGELFILDENQVVSDDLFIGAERVQLDGLVEGDVFIGAKSVVITGEVTGSVFVGASDVNFTGIVGNDLYVGSGTSRLAGEVRDNVYIGSGDVTTTKDFSSGKDLFVGAINALIDGNIAKNLVVGTDNLTVLGTVDESAYIHSNNNPKSGNIVLENKSNIKGNLEYESPEKIEMKRGAHVGGKTLYTPLSKETKGKNVTNLNYNQSSWFNEVLSWLGSFFWLTLLTFIFVAIGKEKVKQFDILSRKNIGSTLGYGIIVGIAIPIMLVLIGITIIGIPVSIIAGLLYVLVLYSGKILTTIVVGKAIFSEKPGEEKKSMYLIAFIGALVVSILGAIPFISGFINVLILGFGLGTFVLYYKSKRKKKGNSPEIKTVKKKVEKKKDSSKKEKVSTSKSKKKS